MPPFFVMPKKTLILLAVLFVANFSAPINGMVQDEFPAEKLKKIDALVDAYLEAGVINSMAIGILDGDIELTKGYGKLSKENPQAPDGDTVFEIGSISKVFTGILLADAINRGIVKADQPAGELLPEGITMPVSKKKPERQITLMHLSTHISGLPRMPDNFDAADPANPYVDYSAEKMFEFLNSHELSRKPGIADEYSNFGVGLLGELLSQKQNSKYETLLVDRISGPLEMSNTMLTLTKDQKERFAPPHDAELAPSSNWEFDALAGAGGIRSTVNDMLKFAQANLSPPDNETGKAIELAFTQQRKSKGFGSSRMGFGWTINMKSETRWHNGQTAGYHSIMFVSREKQRALVVLCNTGTREVDKLASEIMALLGGQDVKPRKFRKTMDVSAEVCARYVGQYSLSPRVKFDITYANDEKTKLMVKLTGQEAFRLHPETETLWYLKVVDADIEFTVDDKGDCTALTLFQNGLQQTAKKQ